MKRRSTARISSKLAACVAAGAFAAACSSTPTTDESADTGSEFQQGDQGEVEEGPNEGYKWEIESGALDQSGLSALYEVVCTVTAPSGRKYTLTYVRYDFT